VPEIDDEQFVREGMEVETEEERARRRDLQIEIAEKLAILVEYHEVPCVLLVSLNLEILHVDVAIAIDGDAFGVGASGRKPREGLRMLAVEAERGDGQEHRENQRLTHLHWGPSRSGIRQEDSPRATSITMAGPAVLRPAVLLRSR